MYPSLPASFQYLNAIYDHILLQYIYTKHMSNTEPLMAAIAGFLLSVYSKL